MDWNTVLFAARWAIIALVYLVLLVLLVGVYREASSRLGPKTAGEPASYGRLKVLQSGSDAHSPAGTLFALKPTTRLGAGPDNDIILGDRYISAHHLRLHWDGAVWWLEDLNSKNGTFVNRQPCPPGRPHPLARGALITAGDMVLELID